MKQLLHAILPRAAAAKAIGWAAWRGLEVWQKEKKQLLPDMIH